MLLEFFVVVKCDNYISFFIFDARYFLFLFIISGNYHEQWKMGGDGGRGRGRAEKRGEEKK